ncbi:MAG: transporter substrate-binding domain-containing protein, partial [Burkholderiaceae bacterium]
MIKKTLGRCTFALSLLAAAAAAQADMLDDVKKARKLRVAIELALPPYGMTNERMQPYGSDVETAQALAKDLGVELEIVPVTGPTRIPFLQTNKADLAIATLSISP